MGIMARWPIARADWHGAETSGPTLSWAFLVDRATNLNQEIGAVRRNPSSDPSTLLSISFT